MILFMNIVPIVNIIAIIKFLVTNHLVVKLLFFLTLHVVDINQYEAVTNVIKHY